MRSFIVLILIVGLLGCSSEVKMKGAPVSVSGKVSQSGQPFGGMVMTFHPLGDGHVREFPVHKDGTFNGELVSGTYAYYVAKPIVPGAAQALRKLPPKYFEADLSRTVTVELGQQLSIALD
ncbi:MAG: hypothetical protein L0228_21795 [Planctomycetes bacterium]|nr:hypothetical protein [Planctomycetota bacterium]